MSSLRWVVIIVLFYLIYRVLRGLTRTGHREGPEILEPGQHAQRSGQADELVQDPVSGVYFPKSEGVAASIGGRGRWLNIRTYEGYLRNCGIETFELIGTASVTRTDADGDGLKEIFTASIATTVTDATQLEVWVKVADRVGIDKSNTNLRWRIPATIEISGGTATVTGNSWLLASPIKYEGVSVSGLDNNRTSLRKHLPNVVVELDPDPGVCW